MKKVVIWGTGQYASYIFKDILMDKCAFEGFVDNNIEKQDRKSTRLNSSHRHTSRMPSSA